MNNEQAAIEQLWNFSCLQLPIGVYFVAPDGRFLACNQPIRQILDLPLEGPVEASIADFYANPNRRHELLEKALAAEARGRYLEKELIHFRVKGEDIFVENYCKPLRDPLTQAIVGYVGCLADVTAEHEAERREDELQRWYRVRRPERGHGLALAGDRIDHHRRDVHVWPTRRRLQIEGVKPRSFSPGI